MKVKVCLVAVFVIGSVVTAFSQEPPSREVSVGYSFLRQEFSTNRHGWVASYAENLNRWAGAKVELGGNYGDTLTFGSGHSHSILAGPQFAFARTSRITPWSHFLVGINIMDIRTVITPIGSPTDTLVPIRFNQVHFAMQPGGGIDYWLGSKVGIRLGADYRLVVRERVRDLDNLRLNAGVVFRCSR